MLQSNAVPVTMMGEPNDMATVCFPDGSSAHVPYVVLRRSHILYDALTETSGVDNTVIHAPVALFHSWLECASLLETREENLADADSDTLLNYLLVRSRYHVARLLLSANAVLQTKQSIPAVTITSNSMYYTRTRYFVMQAYLFTVTAVFCHHSSTIE